MRAFRRFLSVGVINTVVGYCCILVGLWCGLGDYAANALGYGVGLALSYTLHQRWTFGTKSARSLAQFIRFVVAFCLSYSVNLVVLSIARSMGYFEHPVAQATAMTFYTITFYIISRFFVFAVTKEPQQEKNDGFS